MSNLETLLNKLKEQKLTLGSVESLTGGLFSSSICSIPGASASFKGALVTYWASEKTSLCNVKKETIDKYGVVSSQVASEMAIGGKKTLGVDICLSCTGNAGPTVEPGGRAVGDVYLGLCYQNFVWTIPLHFDGDRNFIRENTVEAMATFALSILNI